MDQIEVIDIWKSFLSYVNTFQGGWFRPQTDFETALNNIQYDLWEEWTRMDSKSQEVIDNLRNFLKSANIKVKSAKGNYGTFELPKDYARFSSARIKTNGETTIPDDDVHEGKCEGYEQLELSDEEAATAFYKKMRERKFTKIDNNKWGSALEHETKGPTLDRPLLTQIDGAFKVAPREVSVVVFDYYIKPPLVVFGYDKTPPNTLTGAGDQIIYNKSNSKPLMWPSTMINEFVVRLGERYGLFTRDQFMTQFSTQQKMAG